MPFLMQFWDQLMAIFAPLFARRWFQVLFWIVIIMIGLDLLHGLVMAMR